MSIKNILKPVDPNFINSLLGKRIVKLYSFNGAFGLATIEINGKKINNVEVDDDSHRFLYDKIIEREPKFTTPPEIEVTLVKGHSGPNGCGIIINDAKFPKKSIKESSFSVIKKFFKIL